MSDQHDLTPHEALTQLDEVSRRANRRAKWPAGMFLTIATLNAVLFLAIADADARAARVLSTVPALLVVVVLAFAVRQPVIGREANRINQPVLIAAIATSIAGVVVDQTVLPHHFTGWLVLLAVAMQLPLLVGALLWLRR
jgi:hypothetical protein